MSYDRSIIAAYLYVKKDAKLYPLQYLNTQKEKRIKHWCQQLELEMKGPENHLDEPSLEKFTQKLKVELATRLTPRDFVILTEMRPERILEHKTEQQITEAIARMIASFNL